MNKLPFPVSSNVPYYDNKDIDGYLAMPVENYIRNASGLFVPVSATNPLPAKVQTELPAGAQIIGQVKLTDGTDALLVNANGSINIVPMNSAGTELFTAGNPGNVQLTGSLNKDNLYLLTHELLVNPPPGHFATFGSVAVPAGKVLYISQIYFGGVRTIDHSIAHAYTFSIDGELSLELYNGLYVNCLNLGSPYRMIFNAKGMPAFSTPIIFDRGGLPLYGGNSGSTYYWKIKNEDPLHAMTGNLTIVGQWV